MRRRRDDPHAHVSRGSTARLRQRRAPPREACPRSAWPSVLNLDRSRYRIDDCRRPGGGVDHQVTHGEGGFVKKGLDGWAHGLLLKIT